METRDGFLSRWSRLKRDAGSAPAEEASAVAEEPKVVEEQPLPEGKALEELLAELPKIEDLIPGQSLAAFMQPWVPTAIRNAALHRMWLLDPAISGYVDPALDYAYDYNTLGAAPGFGPMEASQETISEVTDMFDRALARAGGKEDEPMVAASASEHTDQAVGHDADGPEEVPSKAASQSIAPAPVADVAAHNNASDPNDLRPAVRRHGGALPV